MGSHKDFDATVFTGREQSHLRQFILKLFDDGRSPDEAMQALRSRFDTADFARTRAARPKRDAVEFKDLRGPRGKT